MNTDKQKILKNILIVLLYAAITLIMILKHEVWTDEAQVWQICRHLSVGNLFKHLVNEGHPAFYYLILMPFAKMHMNIFAMKIICWLSMCTASFLLLQFSPFNKFTKFSIMVSCPFLYTFPVIARSYSIIPVLLFTIAVLYPKRHQKQILYSILLAILANTHIIMFGFVFTLGALFLYESFKDKKYNFLSLFIIFSGLLAVILQLKGSLSSNVAIALHPTNINQSLAVILTFFMYGYNESIHNFVVTISWFDYILLSLNIILFLAILIILFINKNKSMFLTAFIATIFQFLIYIFSYSFIIYTTRIYVLYIILLFTFWISLTEMSKVRQKLINIVLSLFFILTIWNCYKNYLLDYFYNYSSAKETADFARNNFEKDAFIIIQNTPNCVAIIYYLDNLDLFAVNYNSYIKYIKWQHNINMIISQESWGLYLNYLKTMNNEINIQNKNIYLITPDAYTIKYEPVGFKLIFRSHNAIHSNETFNVYRYIRNKITNN